jgi:ribosomal protein S14
MELNMLFLKIKDLKTRKHYNKKETLRLIKKFVIINLLSRLMSSYTNLKKKEIFMYLLSKYRLDSNGKTKIVRRCILTNRGRSIIRPYNISRLTFKKLNQFGYIPGIQKGIW